MENKGNEEMKETKGWRRVFKSVYFTILLPVVIAILLRMFFIDIYKIPSSSMEPTLVPGDFIIVSKLGIGARLAVNDKNGKETRAPGFSGIKRNEVLVFNFPEGDTIYKNRPDLNFYDYAGWQSHRKAVHDTIEHGGLIYLPVNYRQPFVKRCIGLPGDTVRILRNMVLLTANLQRGTPVIGHASAILLKKTPLAI